MLLALPVIAAVALVHRYLLRNAPSNVLIRRVRATEPALSTAAAMLTVASGLIVALRVVSDAVAAGAPGWLNVVVLVLAWDAIKISWSAVGVALRVASRSMTTVGGLVRRRARLYPAIPDSAVSD